MNAVQSPHLGNGVVGEDNHLLRGLAGRHALMKIQIPIKVRRAVKLQREVEVVGCWGDMWLENPRAHARVSGVEEESETGTVRDMERCGGLEEVKGCLWG